MNHVPTKYKEITLPLSVFTKIWSRCTITHKHIYITTFYIRIPSWFKEKLRLSSQLRLFKLRMRRAFGKSFSTGETNVYSRLQINLPLYSTKALSTPNRLSNLASANHVSIGSVLFDCVWIRVCDLYYQGYFL